MLDHRGAMNSASSPATVPKTPNSWRLRVQQARNKRSRTRRGVNNNERFIHRDFRNQLRQDFFRRRWHRFFGQGINNLLVIIAGLNRP